LRNSEYSTQGEQTQLLHDEGVNQLPEKSGQKFSSSHFFILVSNII